MFTVAVLPTYDEVANLETLVMQLLATVDELTILVVDDSSTDGTTELARKLAANDDRIHLLQRPAKSGLGSAYRDGFAWALERGAEVCVQIDADLSHPPSDLPALLVNVSAGADLAIGSRYVPGGETENWPWHRRWLSRWGNRYSAGLLGLAVNDATAGYRAYRADMLRRIDYRTVQADGYGFQIEMTHRVVRAGGKVVEFPIAFRERDAGQSKLSSSIVREAFWLVPRLWVDDRRDRRRRRRRSG